jgi:hypothetical protein
MRPAEKVIGHVFIATEHSMIGRTALSVIRVQRRVMTAKQERNLGVFSVYGDVKVEIRKPKKSVVVMTGQVSPISLVVVWSEPSDGKGGHAGLLVSSARCKVALPRYHQRSTGEARRWENDWRCRTTNTIVDRT